MSAAPSKEGSLPRALLASAVIIVTAAVVLLSM